MRTGLNQTTTGLRVRPNPELGRTAVLSGAFSLLPVFAAVLWLSRDKGSWPVIVLGEIVVAGIYVAVYIRFRLVHATVTPRYFRKRRLLLRPVQIELVSVDRILVHRVYRSSSTEALTQMLAVDDTGRRLFAMNQLFWSVADIKAVAEAIGCQITSDDTPVSRHEYYRCFPIARRWYAPLPVVIGLVVCVIGLLGLLVVGMGALLGTAA